MVKITFQSVAGQKVEKDNDKSEILIPHAAVSDVQGPIQSAPARPACARPAGPPAEVGGRGGPGRSHRHLDASKTRKALRLRELGALNAHTHALRGGCGLPGRCRWSGNRGSLRPKFRIDC